MSGQRLISNRIRVGGKFLRSGEGKGGKFFVRGVTYGPFGPADERGGLPPRDQRARDLDQIAALGANTVRLYLPPPAEFMDECADRGLRAVAGLDWPQHVDFLHSRDGWERILARCRAQVRAAAGHPALTAWLVGNEIETGLARWLGPRRTLAAIEELIDAARSEDPGTLFAYANYPTTEYLNPRNADFLAFNLYLEDRSAFRRYARRLQVLAGDRPVVVTEFGADAAHHGEARQAEFLAWHIDECRAAGLAGSVLFSFTDEWHRGGGAVTEWKFGICDENRAPRPAAEAVGGRFHGSWLVRAPESDLPALTVIVCTRNGEPTLRACLESLVAVDYPRLEILVVDDGSTDRTPEIVRDFAPAVRLIQMDHAGLSAARNRGAAEARGDIIVYTDDDCIADPDWLRQLVPAFGDPAVTAAGGPNIPPYPRTLAEACVGAAPGAPAQVLFSDTRAEHVPGCNLAVRREALSAIGGFRDEFTAAGDDVDVCWRLLDAGGEIGFEAAAMVWHHRRATVDAYMRQQRGYGRAEGLLIRRHPDAFGSFGGARWRGTVYGGEFSSALRYGSRIYHGPFGSAPFQLVYAAPMTGAGIAVSGFRWFAATMILFAGLPWVWLPLIALPSVMLGAMMTAAAVRTRRAALPARFDGARARMLLFWLHLAQPIVRGAARLTTCLGLGVRPGKHRKPHPAQPSRSRVTRRREIPAGSRTAAFWSESGVGRDALLEKLSDPATHFGEFMPVPSGSWEPSDLRLPLGSWGSAELSACTEYHGGPRQLTNARVRLVVRPGSPALLILVGAIVAAALIPVGDPPDGIEIAIRFIAGAGLLETLRRIQLRKIVSRIRAAAADLGLTEVEKKGLPPRDAAAPSQPHAP